jgi:outer membrane lipoprotein-sorting protein
MRPRLGSSLIALALFGFIAAPGTARAAGMSTDEVLEKYRAAIGGAERWRAVTSMEWQGTETTFSVPAPFTLTRARPNLYRFERTMMKQPVLIVSNGETVWWNNPLMGAAWPVTIPAPESDIIRREAEFDVPLFDPAARGHRVEFAGREDLDGVQSYKLKVVLKDGSEETWFLDPDSFLPLARFAPTAEYGQVMEKQTWFSDYRKVKGLVLPHRMDQEFGTRYELLQLEKVRVNFDVDEALFRMPPPEGMEPLAALAGAWDLKIETRADPRLPWNETQSTATISALLGGRLIEERLDSTGSGTGFDVIRTWSYDRFQQLYRVTVIDSFTGHQNILEGPLEDGRLVVSNVESGTTWKMEDMTLHTRLALHDIGPDGFHVDEETSIDGGENWFTNSRITYTHKSDD